MAQENDSKKPPKDRTLGKGIAFGLVLGSAVGILFDNLAFGAAIGVALGAGFARSLFDDKV